MKKIVLDVNTRLVYVQLPDQEGKYRVCALISKKNTSMVEKLQKVIQAEAEEGKLPAKYHSPLGDGDEKENCGTLFDGMYYINCKSDFEPQYIGKDGQLCNKDEFYSGCYGRVGLNFKCYDYKGKKGITAYIATIQKSAEGPRLDNSGFGSEDFLAVDASFVPEFAPADESDELPFV